MWTAELSIKKKETSRFQKCNSKLNTRAVSTWDDITRVNITCVDIYEPILRWPCLEGSYHSQKEIKSWVHKKHKEETRTPQKTGTQLAQAYDENTYLTLPRFWFETKTFLGAPFTRALSLPRVWIYNYTHDPRTTQAKY